jgi:hypothetical protein
METHMSVRSVKYFMGEFLFRLTDSRLFWTQLPVPVKSKPHFSWPWNRSSALLACIGDENVTDQVLHRH